MSRSRSAEHVLDRLTQSAQFLYIDDAAAPGLDLSSLALHKSSPQIALFENVLSRPKALRRRKKSAHRGELAEDTSGLNDDALQHGEIARQSDQTMSLLEPMGMSRRGIVPREVSVQRMFLILCIAKKELRRDSPFLFDDFLYLALDATPLGLRDVISGCRHVLCCGSHLALSPAQTSPTATSRASSARALPASCCRAESRHTTPSHACLASPSPDMPRRALPWHDMTARPIQTAPRNAPPCGAPPVLACPASLWPFLPLVPFFLLCWGAVSRQR